MGIEKVINASVYGVGAVIFGGLTAIPVYSTYLEIQRILQNPENISNYVGVLITSALTIGFSSVSLACCKGIVEALKK